VDDKKRKEMDGKSGEATKHKRPVWINLLKNKDGGTGRLPFWLFPPYFKFAPTTPAGDGEKWDAFADDALPCDKDDEEKRWEAAPDLIPKAESETHEDEPDPRYT
jgi:hypothetical protein